MSYKQFGYRSVGIYDKSYKIEERSGRFYVEVDYIFRSGQRSAATPTRTLRADFALLSEAQTFIGKKT